MNAISIPEKKADNNSVATITIMDVSTIISDYRFYVVQIFSCNFFGKRTFPKTLPQRK
tara:strand:+ start:766 stop:939 length:174 start_codon:yes stop_codon:yes gene_type:complete